MERKFGKFLLAYAGSQGRYLTAGRLECNKGMSIAHAELGLKIGIAIRERDYQNAFLPDRGAGDCTAGSRGDSCGA